MSRRQATQIPSRTGTKFLFLLAAAALIFWAGRDPAGAAALARHLGQALAHAHAPARTARSTTP